MGRKVIVIGAGASGLMAAIAAARSGAAVTVLERQKKPGRKLLITGNGRCNLTNLTPELWYAYNSVWGIRNDPYTSLSEYAEQVIGQFDAEETLCFFQEIGVGTISRNLLVYPMSEQAQTVLSALLFESERLGISLKYNVNVRAIRRDETSGTWHADAEGWSYEADRVILACGSATAPAAGGDMGGYALAEMAGHTVTPLYPALTGLLCGDEPMGTASGARTRAFAAVTGHTKEELEEIALFERTGAEVPGRLLRGESLLEEEGEVQWTDRGLSGIVVFNLSRAVIAASEAPVHVELDLVPGLKEEELSEAVGHMLRHMQASLQIKEPHVSARKTTDASARTGDRGNADELKEDRQLARRLLMAWTNDRVADFLLERGSKSDADVPRFDGTPESIARMLKCVRLPVTGTRSYEQAQVCAGGVSLDEVDPETLESRIAPGLFLSGELLDVDGPCGGFNLQWAWSSGFVAGCHAAK